VGIKNIKMFRTDFSWVQWVQLKGIVYVFIKIDARSIADGKIDKTYDLMKVKFLMLFYI